MKRIQTLEDGRVPVKEANNWKIEGEKNNNYEKGVYERLLNNFEMEGVMAQKRPVEFRRRRQSMKERRELPNEEGDAVKEHKAMHEEDFWSSWLKEEERGKEERMAED